MKSDGRRPHARGDIREIELDRFLHGHRFHAVAADLAGAVPFGDEVLRRFPRGEVQAAPDLFGSERAFNMDGTVAAAEVAVSLRALLEVATKDSERHALLRSCVEAHVPPTSEIPHEPKQLRELVFRLAGPTGLVKVQPSTAL